MKKLGFEYEKDIPYECNDGTIKREGIQCRLILENTTNEIPFTYKGEKMKILIHDLDESYDLRLRNKCEKVIRADGKYAPCQGCFGCWTKQPAQCYMKDKLQMVCRMVGNSDHMVIITENYYGTYSPMVKNVLDRCIGISTPLSTYRGKQMHHTLRYGKKEKLIVYVYGDMTAEEENTFRYMVERNAINYGFCEYEFRHLSTLSGLEELEL